MELTQAQKTALLADIAADPVLSTVPNTSDGAVVIADAYNVIATPDYWVWRTRVERKEFVENTSLDPDGTTQRTFNWTGTGFITRSQGERDAWRELWNHTGAVNPSLSSIRQAFQDIFSGATAPAPSNRQHLLNIARRKASRIEKLFATGTGTAASPATMGAEGPITYPEILAIRAT